MDQEREEPGRSAAGDPGKGFDDTRDRIEIAIPPAVRQHLRAARREFWLAVRALVDARLANIEARDEPEAAPRRGRVELDD